ncbi:MAG: alpha/beta hydrolase [Planctomycetota bacterium]
MSRKRYWMPFVATILGFAFASFSTVAQTNGPDANYAYVDGGGPRQSLDIYQAKAPDAADSDRSARPAIVFVHGGGWWRGNKLVAREIAQPFTEAGIHVVSVGYRLVPDIEWPTNIRDVAAAVDWVFNHAEELGIDPAKITLMGHSAGAHLVAGVGADPRWLGEHDRTPEELHAVVLLDGAGYDVTAVMANAGEKRRQTYRRAFTTNPDVWADASPARHVPEAGPVCPNWLSIIDDNRPASHRQSGWFFDALQATGQASTEVIPTQKSHSEVLCHLGNPGDPEAKRVIELAAQAASP